MERPKPGMARGDADQDQDAYAKLSGGPSTRIERSVEDQYVGALADLCERHPKDEGVMKCYWTSGCI